MINIYIKDSVSMNGDISLFVKFDYDEKILNIIRAFPTRTYQSKDKSWELPFNQLGKLVDRLSDYDITIEGKYIILETEKIEIPSDFNFKTTPYQHQIEGLEYGLNHDKWLLGDEQGLGKTKQVIDNLPSTIMKSINSYVVDQIFLSKDRMQDILTQQSYELKNEIYSALHNRS